jgi:tetratricopeptide (TPR) repeat protein
MLSALRQPASGGRKPPDSFGSQNQGAYAPRSPGRLILVALALCLAVPGAAHAALDPELKTPYQLQIVLQVAEHRLLTPVFQEQLARELRDHLQLTYGALARVEVVRGHKLLKDVRARGLEALDSWRELSPLKTHFVLIDYADGQYRIRARQQDGATGLASPVIRSVATSERNLVARTAARLVDQDFGLNGTVVRVQGKDIEVAIKGGALGVPLGRWIRRGEVFAIARLTKEGGKQRSERVLWALLQVADEPSKGICRCRLYDRFEGETVNENQPGVLGYRCLKLTTIRGPLRLRVVTDDKQEAFLNGVRVDVRRTPDDRQPWARTTGLDGLIVTPDSYLDVAFVKVSRGGDDPAVFAVEIVDDRITKCPVAISAKAVALGQVNLRRDRWVRRAIEDLHVVAGRFSDLKAALERSTEAGLDMARQVRQGIVADVDSLTGERNQLYEAGKSAAGLDLSEGEQWLQRLQERRGELDRLITGLEEAIREANSPQTKALQTKLERARLRETEADYDGALALYEEVLRQRPNQPQIKAYLDKLKAAWQTKDAAHTQAREFIYQTWPRLEPADLKVHMDQAARAFVTCRERGDRLTLRKLRQGNTLHAVKINKRLGELRWDGDDPRAETRTLIAVAGQLRRLEADVTAFLTAGKPAGK